MDAEKLKVMVFDWRIVGDISAVGQLLEKILISTQGINVTPVQAIGDSLNCVVYELGHGQYGSKKRKPYLHDAFLNFVKSNPPNIFYIRISPHEGLLTLICKVISILPNIPIVIHYMDNPSFNGFRKNKKSYVYYLYQHVMTKASYFFTINEAGLNSITNKYNKPSKVLANFIEVNYPLSFNVQALKDKEVSIGYFGSIDSKMNLTSLYAFCELISKHSWVKFTLYSNSGIPSQFQKISKSSKNIVILESNLPPKLYRERIREFDFVLLAYNFDNKSQAFLSESFSNKLIDYLEAGAMPICIGGASVPTLKFCVENKIGLSINSESQLENIFSSRSNFISSLSNIDFSSYGEAVSNIERKSKASLNEFRDVLFNLRSQSTYLLQADSIVSSDNLLQSNKIEMMLSFLIKRKFYDRITGQQSLSASLMAVLLKQNGYGGINYEI